MESTSTNSDNKSISREKKVIEDIGLTRKGMKDIKFLENDEKLDRVVYASYPRSGNSFMRNNFEQISGIYTGGTMGECMELDKPLKEAGFAGEYEREDKVWIVYSHYPILSEFDFNVKRIILGVRNPFDVMDSFFNLLMTKSQNKSLAEDEYIKYKDIFEQFVRDSTREWKNFHEFWLAQNIPIHIVRYEDILNKREDSLVNIFQYLYRTTDIGEFTQQKIRDLIANIEKREIYKPRKAQINYGMNKYSDELKQYMLTELDDLLNKFGYSNGIVQEETTDFIREINEENMQAISSGQNQDKESNSSEDDSSLYLTKELLSEDVQKTVNAFDKLCLEMMTNYYRQVVTSDAN